MGHQQLTLIVSGHGRRICANNDYVVLICQEGLVHVLDQGYQLLRTLEIGHITAAENAILIYDDHFLIGDKSGAVSTWNLLEGARQSGWCLHTPPVVALAFIDDNKTLVACSYTDGTIPIVDRKTVSVQQSLIGHGASMVKLLYSKTLSTFVSYSLEAGIRLWDLETGKCEAAIESTVRVAQWAGDDKRLATGSHGDSSLYIWSIVDGSLLAKLTPLGPAKGTLDIEPYSVADYNGLLSTHKDGSIRIWDCDQQVQLYAFHTGKKRCGFLCAVLASICEGPQTVHKIVTGSPEGILNLWRIPAPERLHSGQTNSEDPEDMPSPRGEKLLRHSRKSKHSYATSYPLVVLSTSIGLAPGAVLYKFALEDDTTISAGLETEFHLLHFDDKTW